MNIWVVSVFKLLWIVLLWRFLHKDLIICFQSFGCLPRSGIAGSYGNSMFNFLRYHQTVLHSGFTILHSQQCRWVSTSPHPYQHLLFSIFWIIAILVCVKHYLTEVLICISLMTNYVEQFFMWFLDIFFGEISVQVLCPFKKLCCFSFWCWDVRVLYIFWILDPYQIYDLQIFSPILYIVFSPSW